MLYEPNVKLSDLTFDDLYYRMKPRIEFHCQKNINRDVQLIKGYDYDDLFQELSIKLWRMRIPDDIIYYDWRFLQYVDKAFKFHIFDLAKKRRIRKKDKTLFIFRDVLDISTSFSDTYDKYN